MTHCAGYRAAVVARDSDSVSLGIDAEVDQPLPARLVDRIALPEERERLARLNDCGVSVDRLLFCVKETVYKAWYPITGRFLDFPEASVMLHPDGTFTAEVRLTRRPPRIRGPPRSVAAGSPPTACYSVRQQCEQDTLVVRERHGRCPPSPTPARVSSSNRT